MNKELLDFLKKECIIVNSVGHSRSRYHPADISTVVCGEEKNSYLEHAREVVDDIENNFKSEKHSINEYWNMFNATEYGVDKYLPRLNVRIEIDDEKSKITISDKSKMLGKKIIPDESRMISWERNLEI